AARLEEDVGPAAAGQGRRAAGVRIEHLHLVTVGLGDGEEPLPGGDAERVLQPDHVADAVHVTELELVEADYRLHRVGAPVDRPDRGRLAVGDVQPPVVGGGDAAG